MMFGRTVDRWRETLALPRRRGRHDPLRRPDGSPAPVLHAISRHVLPRPADWPATAAVTGYWFLADTTPEDEQPPLPHPLIEFLEAGEPPVFISFGSMAGPDPAATTATVLEATRRTGSARWWASRGAGSPPTPPTTCSSSTRFPTSTFSHGSPR